MLLKEKLMNVKSSSPFDKLSKESLVKVLGGATALNTGGSSCAHTGSSCGCDGTCVCNCPPPPPPPPSVPGF
jgi:hypothetical protein